MTNSYETVNDVLVKLFKEIMGIEEKALITSEYKDISVNDMHVIEAIGIHEKKNMSAVAKALSVTVGTVTIAINNLVKKGYVKRVRSEKDRRIVLVSLSAKGERAYNHHRMFHDRMVLAVLDGLNKEETEVLMKVLGNLQNFFRNYEHTDQAGQSRLLAPAYPGKYYLSRNCRGFFVFLRFYPRTYFLRTGNCTGPASSTLL